MTTPASVCVIGAGISGLTACKQLLDHGISFDCFDMSNDLGGNWRYDNQNGRSAAYASLHIDTSKERFAFADLPMPVEWPAYLHHSQVCAYLDSYADTFALRDEITFRHQVVSVEPADGRWIVTVRDLISGSEDSVVYNEVIVATGHHWDPNIPDTDGSFAGTTMHAQTYRTPEPFIGKDVVVVGVGNTGVDLASELSWHARSVTLAARSGAHVLPRFVFGRPLDNYSSLAGSKLPLSVQRVVYKALLLAARGRQSSYGFPEPDAPLLAQHPTVSQDVLQLVKDGHIEMQPGISRTTEDEVVFTNGESAPCDVIIYATGYNISFPFLPESVASVDGNHIDLYKRVVSAEHPGLYFIGLIQPVGALPPLAEQQARWVTQLIAGASLPSVPAMKAEIERDRQEVEGRYQARPRHTIQVDYWIYLDAMRQLADENERTLGDLPAVH